MRALGKSLGQVTLKKLLWGRWVRNLRSPVMSLSASLTSLPLQRSDRNSVFSAPLFLSPGDKRLSMLAGIDSGVSLWLFLVRKILELQPVPQDGLAISFSSLSDGSDPFPVSSSGQTRAFPCIPHSSNLPLYILCSAIPLCVFKQVTLPLGSPPPRHTSSALD